MLTSERQKKITDILKEYKHIDVSSLSSILNVTEATIRKDLEKLENIGVLTRMHGGAILNNLDSTPSFSINDPSAKEKSSIAKLASELISQNEVVFLGLDPICYYIARNLSSVSNLNVITNNVAIINELSTYDNINLIALGGEIKRINEQACMYGKISNSNLSNFHINKAFISFDGVHDSIGYTLSDSSLLDMYKILNDRSEEVISVCDSSKYNNISMLNFCGITEIKKVITSKDIPNLYKKIYFESGIQLFTTICSNVDG